MIVSKPITSTLISFTLFVIITFVVIGMNIYAIQLRGAWYNYLTIGLLFPIAGFVIYKIFVRYKVLILGNNQIEVNFPVLRQFRKYKLDNVQFWVENQVKTGKNSVYRELVIKFSDGQKVSLSPKESTEYDRTIQYLKQKLPRKKVVVH
ncbi:MAG: hypothetical protein ACKO96_40200 [Flammeovirgaceae bacterium]